MRERLPLLIPDIVIAENGTQVYFMNKFQHRKCETWDAFLHQVRGENGGVQKSAQLHTVCCPQKQKLATRPAYRPIRVRTQCSSAEGGNGL